MIHGRRISYHSHGKGGIPIVLIPPPMVGSAVFQKQAAGLSSNFQVILMELPGHERSEPSHGPLTYPGIARDICGLLDHLNFHKAVICGYSMAGSVVFEFARTYPDRILGGVPISGFSEATDMRIRAEISAGATMAKIGAMRTLAFTLSLANADGVRSLQNMYRIGIQANRGDVTSMFQYALAFNCTHDLPKIHTPMQLIFGAKDRRLYKYASILERSLPNKRMIKIQGARHQLPLKNDTELNRHIADFVSSLV